MEGNTNRTTAHPLAPLGRGLGRGGGEVYPKKWTTKMSEYGQLTHSPLPNRIILFLS